MKYKLITQYKPDSTNVYLEHDKFLHFEFYASFVINRKSFSFYKQDVVVRLEKNELLLQT